MDLAASGDATPADETLGESPVDDGTLLRLVRAGDDSAFAALFARHAAAVRGYALRCCADVVDAEDMAAEAFFRVLQAVRRGSGPADNVRGYLFTVVRRLAAEWSLRKRDVPVADDELGRQLEAARPAAVASRADLQLIAAAFTTLPRRWRAVLWRVEVEGERPAAAASHFGLSPNATAALARRARQGLRAAYLQAHLAPAGGATECRTVVAKLGAFTAGQVTGTEATRIRDHLGGCRSCQVLHAELEDVCAGLRRHASALAPLAGGALGGRHLLLGRALLGRVGHALAVGARAKLAVAALSVVAVGGVGFAAGPLIARLDASPTVNRAVGPVLLSTTSTSRSSPPRLGGPSPERIAGAFAPTRARGHVRPDGITRTMVRTGGAVVPVARAVVPGGVAAGSAVPGTAVTSNGPTGTGPTTGEATMPQLFAVPTSSAADSVTTSPDATAGADLGGTTDAGTPDPGSTVSSTSWTSDGTTVRVWTWSRLW